MKKNWIKEINAGVLPSELLTEEYNKMDECFAGALVRTFLAQTLPDDYRQNSKIDTQDMYYPIWYWEKPDKIRKDGISTEVMDEWILKILASWGVIE